MGTTKHNLRFLVLLLLAAAIPALGDDLQTLRDREGAAIQLLKTDPKALAHQLLEGNELATLRDPDSYFFAELFYRDVLMEALCAQDARAGDVVSAAMAALRSFWQNREISSAQRCHSVVGAARRFFTVGRPVEADRLLDQWIASPDYVPDPNFYYQRFFVKLHGLGDRETARKLLREFSEKVEAGTFQESDQGFLAMSETYYRVIWQSELQVRKEAYAKMHTFEKQTRGEIKDE